MTARRLWPILTSAGEQGLPPAPANDRLHASANRETITSAVLDILCLARHLQSGCTLPAADPVCSCPVGASRSGFLGHIEPSLPSTQRVYCPCNQPAKSGSAHFYSLKIVCSAFRRRCSPRILFDVRRYSPPTTSSSTHCLTPARPCFTSSARPEVPSTQRPATVLMTTNR